MTNYWKGYYSNLCKEYYGSPLRQVGKTVNGIEIDSFQVKLIVEDIVSVLQLSPTDSIIDLCCGNGLITSKLAPFTKKVLGVDFSIGLINLAIETNNPNNIEYINCDVLELDSKYLKGKKKILMYEALQHFSTLQLRKLLLHITKLESGSLFMIGSVPDKKKLNVYYNTPEKLKFYLQREKLRKPHMGRWWLKKELSQLVSEYDLNLTILPQPSKLYTAYYRFNVLLEKC